MDAKALVAAAGIGLLAFLFYPRSDAPKTPGSGEWVETAKQIEGEPLKLASWSRADPPTATLDLGFVYLLDRAQIEFENAAEDGPRVYEIVVSKERNAAYQRVFTFRSSSRNYPYAALEFQNRQEGRWVQAAVNDWFSVKPAVKSFQVGPVYTRVWSPIQRVETSHNPDAANLLIDGVSTDESTWAGAEKQEAEEQETEKEGEPQFQTPAEDVWAVIELKEEAVVYGMRVATGGPGNGVRAYQAHASLDGERFRLMGSASDLPDEPILSRLMFQEPVKARYLRIEIKQDEWHGAYPALREIEAFTDRYRPAPSVQQDGAGGVSFIQIRRDNCGQSLERSPHMTQGFPYDRGGGEPENRYGWIEKEEIEGEAEENLRAFAYHYDAVRFHYDGLSKDRLYTLYVSYLQNADGGRRQNLTADGYLLHGDEPVPTAAQPPRIFAVPPQAVEDGELVVSVNRLAGPNAVVSEISLYESAQGADESDAGDRRTAKIVQAHAPLTIDGKLDDWSRLHPLRVGDGEPSVWAEWDDSSLYIALSIPLPLLSEAPSLQDAFDLFIDARVDGAEHAPSLSIYQKGDVHIRLLRIGGTPAARYVRHESEQGAEAPMEIPAVKTAARSDGGLYTLEIQLPKEGALPDWEPKIDRLIGLNYILSLPNTETARWHLSARRPHDPPVRWLRCQLIGSIQGRMQFGAAPDDFETADGGVFPYFAGGSLWAMAYDPDANRDPSVEESISAVVSGGAFGEEIRLELREGALVVGEGGEVELAPSADSERFFAPVQTEYAEEPLNAADRISARGGELLTVSYEDSFARPDGSAETASAQASAVTGADGEIQMEPAGRFTAGDMLRITAVDGDEHGLLEIIEETAAEETDEATEDASNEEEAEAPTQANEETAEAPTQANEAAAEVPTQVKINGREAVVSALDLGEARDVEKIVLKENESGAYEGELPTVYSVEPVRGDGVLQIAGNQIAQAAYIDKARASGETDVSITASARAAAGDTALLQVRMPGGAFENGGGAPALFRAGAPLIVRVRDADLNKDPSIADTALIQAEGSILNDSLTIKLTEMLPNSGLFEGAVPTRYGVQAEQNETIEAAGGERILFKHLDALQATGEPNVLVEAHAEAETGGDGRLAIVRGDDAAETRLFNAGDLLHLRLAEPDDIGQEALVRLETRGENGQALDSESVYLRRSASDSQLYLGSIPTAYGAPVPSDETLQARGGIVVRAVYQDALRASGETNIEASAEAEANAGSDGKLRTLDLFGEKEADAFRAGEAILIEVKDDDLNVSDEAIETASAEAREDFLGDSVVVVLKETTGSSGVFRGELRTQYADAAVEDNLLQAQGQSYVVVAYIDALSADGEAQAERTAALYAASGERGRVAALTLDGERRVGNLHPNGTALIRVVDGDLNEDPLFQESTEVTAEGNLLRDQLRLHLRETGLDTGVFEARLETELSSEANRSDLLLQTAEKETVTIVYVDALTDAGEPNAPASVRLVVAGSSPGRIEIVEADGTEMTAFTAGEWLYVAIQDLLLAADPNIRPAALFTASESGDQARAVLEPVPGADGQFWGRVATRYSLLPARDNTLDVRGGETVAATYAPEGLFGRLIADATIARRGQRGQLSAALPDGSPLLELAPGDTAVALLYDSDRNADPFAVETAEAYASAQDGAEPTPIRLRETAPNSGAFRGDVLTSYGKEAPAGALGLTGGETIKIAYVDPLTDTGEAGVEIETTVQVRKVGFAPYSESRLSVTGVPNLWALDHAMSTPGEEIRVWAQWTRDALYFFIQVEDDSPVVEDVTRWHIGSDAVELHLTPFQDEYDLPKHLSPTGAAPGAAFWICPRGGGYSGEDPYIGQAAPRRVYNLSGGRSGFEAAVKTTDGYYTIEARLPYGAALGGFDPFTSAKRRKIGFNFLLYRSDAAQVWWAEPLRRPSGAGVLYLEGGP
ncbi:MAG: hypothetical protein OXT69_07410 [Candidatus Poribacteria bacterium]|nr:hypothetical protein [Candidatus Poribacteria bacterium]